ncbi:pentatricopeptide repeat-containing protein At5g46580, chloroplastic-like [Cucurbita pepo subsp. pepo]|uniref:pentatricopeptide repeat-containing protein At5g46580, chloroplastic-like n=1 Tax=Cucurbita pepo subsp. pepo TaxID=3664 RepID=UPI000C9D80CB|nr:pentatricopeptide repeat-containing protein At5g46580, chloroplastic-like [Cucurbita pepo subsp. pepo]
MAAPLSSSLDIKLKLKPTPPLFFTSPLRRNNFTKRLTVLCTSSSKSPRSTDKKNPSLSEQLKDLSTSTLSNASNDESHLLSNSKSIWVNPTKPKRSVLSLQRQKRSSYSYNPKMRELKTFAHKLNASDSSEAAFMAVLKEIPHPPTKENALLILNSLKPWQKTHLFFNWIKTQNLFPMETIFYNVAMKSLRYGRQFQLIEELANEMINTGIELDNITYSTIITCAKKCSRFDKAMEWFERMYRTGLMPDEVTYSAILDVYANLGKVEEALSLYERGRASGWKPDPYTFSVLGKMFGEAGDYDGIMYVLQEMKSIEVQPNLVVYNTLLDAMGKAGRPGFARSLFEEMIESGITPNEKTLTALVKIYGKARWARDALELWERMRSKGWPMDFILYNTLLNMCADLGLEEEAEKLFEEMKKSEHSRPDSWSYTAMLNIHGSGGNVKRSMELFEEMLELGVGINVMCCTCLIQCLGKARRIDDLVRVFDVSIRKGVKPDDRFCGCLLSVVSLCDNNEDISKVFTCLQQANPKLVAFVNLLQQNDITFDVIKDEFRTILGETASEARRPFCNCLIDICRNQNLSKRAHELLYLGSLYGLYPGLHNKTEGEWCLDVRSLSVGAAQTALEEWMITLSKIVQREEALPELLSAQTGAGTHRFSQGLANSFASHVEKLAAPFRLREDRAGWFVATREDFVAWVHSRVPSVATTA